MALRRSEVPTKVIRRRTKEGERQTEKVYKSGRREITTYHKHRTPTKKVELPPATALYVHQWTSSARAEAGEETPLVSTGRTVYDVDRQTVIPAIIEHGKYEAGKFASQYDEGTPEYYESIEKTKKMHAEGTYSDWLKDWRKQQEMQRIGDVSPTRAFRAITSKDKEEVKDISKYMMEYGYKKPPTRDMGIQLIDDRDEREQISRDIYLHEHERAFPGQFYTTKTAMDAPQYEISGGVKRQEMFGGGVPLVGEITRLVSSAKFHPEVFTQHAPQRAFMKFITFGEPMIDAPSISSESLTGTYYLPEKKTDYGTLDVMETKTPSQLESEYLITKTAAYEDKAAKRKSEMERHQMLYTTGREKKTVAMHKERIQHELKELRERKKKLPESDVASSVRLNRDIRTLEVQLKQLKGYKSEVTFAPMEREKFEKISPVFKGILEKPYEKMTLTMKPEKAEKYMGRAYAKQKLYDVYSSTKEREKWFKKDSPSSYLARGVDYATMTLAFSGVGVGGGGVVSTTARGIMAPYSLKEAGKATLPWVTGGLTGKYAGRKTAKATGSEFYGEMVDIGFTLGIGGGLTYIGRPAGVSTKFSVPEYRGRMEAVTVPKSKLEYKTVMKPAMDEKALWRGISLEWKHKTHPLIGRISKPEIPITKTKQVSALDIKQVWKPEPKTLWRTGTPDDIIYTSKKMGVYEKELGVYIPESATQTKMYLKNLPQDYSFWQKRHIGMTKDYMDVYAGVKTPSEFFKKYSREVGTFKTKKGVEEVHKFIREEAGEIYGMHAMSTQMSDDLLRVWGRKPLKGVTQDVDTLLGRVQPLEEVTPKVSKLTGTLRKVGEKGVRQSKTPSLIESAEGKHMVDIHFYGMEDYAQFLKMPKASEKAFGHLLKHPTYPVEFIRTQRLSEQYLRKMSSSAGSWAGKVSPAKHRVGKDPSDAIDLLIHAQEFSGKRGGGTRVKEYISSLKELGIPTTRKTGIEKGLEYVKTPSPTPPAITTGEGFALTGLGKTYYTVKPRQKLKTPSISKSRTSPFKSPSISISPKKLSISPSPSKSVSKSLSKSISKSMSPSAYSYPKSQLSISPSPLPKSTFSISPSYSSKYSISPSKSLSRSSPSKSPSPSPYSKYSPSMSLSISPSMSISPPPYTPPPRIPPILRMGGLGRGGDYRGFIFGKKKKKSKVLRLTTNLPDIKLAGFLPYTKRKRKKKKSGGRK